MAKSTNRFICIHGHFYQPPRENPWLQAIELQESAHPYHDWNERIAAECYAPNAKARILDEQGRITRIVNNYSRISFNFGPTLLEWMEPNAPEVYQAILEADRESLGIFSGHGSALAQPYHHMVMPLANRKDKYTQVVWGIRDFEHRFQRQPEGMWLAETAVDLETLETLAELDIRFTILAPHQAQRVRPLQWEMWQDVSNGRIDTTQPYTLHLPSGKNINLFFYDGALSHAIAFDGILSKGEEFAQRILGAFSEDHDRPQLVHMATDGETYGHHHKFGEMALAYVLGHIKSSPHAQLTVYGEFLEKYPPTHEVEIFENTSWSCAHGVERWQSNCGCHIGGSPEWNQAWRRPLREALDWLRDTLAPAFKEKARGFLNNPWEARNEYIQIVLDRSPENVDRFLARNAGRELSDAEKITALKLLELQRHAMLMYTSCGWFFDDVSGIETVQIIQYAGQVIQLARQIFGDVLEPRFLELLERAESNLPEEGNARRIYEKSVTNAMVDPLKLCAHLAVNSLFEEFSGTFRIYCYTVELEDFQRCAWGEARLALGRARITSELFRESSDLVFGVLHEGDFNLKGHVHEFKSEEDYQRIVEEVTDAFNKGDFPETLRRLEQHFSRSTFSLKGLFRDEQKKFLDAILETTLTEDEPAYNKLYESYAPLQHFYEDMGIASPKTVSAFTGLVLEAGFRQALASREPDFDRIEGLMEEAELHGISLDPPTLEYALGKSIERLARRFSDSPNDLFLLQNVKTAMGLAESLSFQVNLWETQNVCCELVERVYPDFKEKAGRGDETAGQWVAHFLAWAEKLSVRVDDGIAKS